MVEKVLKEAEDKMKKSIQSLKSEFATIRSGRANTAILDHIMVEAYGSSMPINQLGTVSVPEARSILIQPWDKNVMQDIEKAIQKSDLGLNPINDGIVIRINLPELTEERRREMVKLVKSKEEDAKISIRNIRRTGNEHLKELGKEHISEDLVRDSLDRMQRLTDKYIAEIQDLTEKKEKDIMTV
jgi:ribosome recycling factor